MALGAMEIMRFFYVNFQILFQTADIVQNNKMLEKNKVFSFLENMAIC